MANIRKLLLVRLANNRADLIDKGGLTTFFKGKAIPVSPAAWAEESGLSHYGFLLEGMKLKDLEMLKNWNNQRPDDTILDVEEDVESTLAGVGLRVNDLAE